MASCIKLLEGLGYKPQGLKLENESEISSYVINLKDDEEMLRVGRNLSSFYALFLRAMLSFLGSNWAKNELTALGKQTMLEFRKGDAMVNLVFCRDEKYAGRTLTSYTVTPFKRSIGAC